MSSLLRWVSVLAALACLTVLAACPVDDPSPVVDDDDTDGDDDDSTVAPTCSDRANLRVVATDAWGRSLSVADVGISPLSLEVAGVWVMSEEPANFSLSVEAADHDRATVSVSYDGGATAASFSATATGGDARIAAAWEDADCPTWTLAVGLDHQWFAGSALPPSGNDVAFLMDGEEAWAAVAESVAAASERVSLATWFWQSDFELTRGWGWSDEQRADATAMATLASLDGVTRRLLINRFWGENNDFSIYLNTDTALRDRAEAASDDFEVVLQGNPTVVPIDGLYGGEPAPWSYVDRLGQQPAFAGWTWVFDDDEWTERDLTLDAASFHQKFLVVDGEIAFVGGMNTKSADWDSNEHAVFNPLRMDFDASAEDRQAVADREQLPDIGPRKDYVMKVEGPAARDVEDVMVRRWDHAIANGALFTENATSFELDPAAAEGSAMTQIVQTMPEPWADMSILDTHRKALMQAERYIFIEDQYFRAPVVMDEIAARMAAEPDLLLTVVTMPVSTLDGGLKYTYIMDEYLRSLFPDRYQTFQLVSFDLVTEEGQIWDDVDFHQVPINTHSKIRIVDDTYLSVGSCNFNNRGYFYEGEMNTVVVDDEVARDARTRVFENLVGADFVGLLSDDPQNNFDVLAMAAQNNADIAAWWDENAADLDWDEAEAAWAATPTSGFLMPLQFESDYFEVGPDVF